MRNIAMTALILLGVLSSCNSQNSVSVNGEKVKLDDGIYAKFVTPKGEILTKLYYERVPMTVANFVGLAEGKIENDAKAAGEPYFDGLKFHRVIKDFMIQGGDPQGTGSGGPGYQFPDEFHPDLKHDSAGVLSMANAGPGTNGSQFFITHKPTPHLDNKHSVFGQVIQGQDVVDKVEKGDAMEKVEIIRKGKEAKNFDAPAVFASEKEEQMAAKKKADAERKKAQEAKIDELTEGMEKTESGLYYEITEEAEEGASAEAGKTVSVHYRGQLPDGTVFDESYKRGKPIQFPLGQGRVIKGWDEGIALMQVGEKARLVIPPNLGYGSRAQGPIPANSWLIFDVELVDVK